MKDTQLFDDLLQAWDNYLGETCSGPWEELAQLLASVVSVGVLTLADAARFDQLLQRTK